MKLIQSHNFTSQAVCDTNCPIVYVVCHNFAYSGRPLFEKASCQIILCWFQLFMAWNRYADWRLWFLVLQVRDANLYVKGSACQKGNKDCNIAFITILYLYFNGQVHPFRQNSTFYNRSLFRVFSAQAIPMCSSLTLPSLWQLWICTSKFKKKNMHSQSITSCDKPENLISHHALYYWITEQGVFTSGDQASLITPFFHP